jgi:geranylgeranyl diphosphate synthase type I
MDVYEQIKNSFSSIPYIDAWSELSELFRRVASQKPYHWTLPILACESVGGSSDQAIPAAVAIACSHIGIILVDDMLDSDPRGEDQRVGMPAAANMACALQSAALAVVTSCKINVDTKVSVITHLNEMFLKTTLGQYLDAQSPADEQAYWRIVQTKSSPFFGAALLSGALLGGASFEVASILGELGSIYGEMIQIHDDLNDVMEVPANPDWTEKRSPLPILFARLTDHPDRLRFLEFYDNISKPGALEEAQAILIRSGAISYCIDRLICRHKSARKLLDSVPLVRRYVLDHLLEEIIAPVHKLFESIGEQLPTNDRPRNLE